MSTMGLEETMYGYSGKRVAYIYHEETTDVLYIKPYGGGSGFTVMLDPETGLPLTYKVWKAKYYKK